MIRRATDWQRVSKRRPCPVCEKPDWCLYVGPDGVPTAAICSRIESPKRAGAIEAASARKLVVTATRKKKAGVQNGRR